MNNIGWCVTTNGDGWYLLPSVYLWPGKNINHKIVYFDIGITFLRWSLVVTFYRRRIR